MKLTTKQQKAFLRTLTYLGEEAVYTESDKEDFFAFTDSGVIPDKMTDGIAQLLMAHRLQSGLQKELWDSSLSDISYEQILRDYIENSFGNPSFRSGHVGPYYEVYQIRMRMNDRYPFVTTSRLDVLDATENSKELHEKRVSLGLARQDQTYGEHYYKGTALENWRTS